MAAMARAVVHIGHQWNRRNDVGAVPWITASLGNGGRPSLRQQWQFRSPARRRISTSIGRRPALLACLPPSSSQSPPAITSTKLYVSGLSFRTTEKSLMNAFQKFGDLVEVNLVIDRKANRPRGFAFLLYATEEESKKAIEGMHGKFLDGRVIFVEVAKPRSELRQNLKQN
ncbi:organelle RRM domain-containing protein 6, chloroplastic [Diospyros lotus]|uniref:organelle RRM domain-containing protein 6, chloroplastic n=1 Tax=Diospyros lotus TaxID=55363 RepID=UPI002254B62D|nr:organelle RRM domain-containing protein 6, chloroplastic [Diospyros lotus]